MVGEERTATQSSTSKLSIHLLLSEQEAKELQFMLAWARSGMQELVSESRQERQHDVECDVIAAIAAARIQTQREGR
jgi:hypothetical protein